MRNKYVILALAVIACCAAALVWYDFSAGKSAAKAETATFEISGAGQLRIYGECEIQQTDDRESHKLVGPGPHNLTVERGVKVQAAKGVHCIFEK